MRRSVIFLIVLVLLLTFFGGVCFAHKITTFAYVDENGVINTETYFSGGAKAKGAKVMVYDNSTGKLLLQGKTDDKGRFNFKPPALTDLKIVVEAELGHRAVAFVKKKDFEKFFNQEAETKAKPASTSSLGISEKELSQILDKKIKPLYDMMLKMEEKLSKPSLTEIIGGIGYIFGVFGIVAMILARRKG